MNKTFLAIAMTALMGLSGCGGRSANPVIISQSGDQQLSCKGLKFEMENIKDDIQRLLPSTDKTAQNIALGVAGSFLLVPLFFMDFKNADKAEYDALRQRYNYLLAIAISKNCPVKSKKLPSVEQMKAEYKKQQAAE
jgi:hypothetical protein